MATLPSGPHFFRGAPGYEDARRATVWNARLPQRFPDVIVQARDADDVVAAIRYARAGRTGTGSGCARAATAGRPTTCATAACSWT